MEKIIEMLKEDRQKFLDYLQQIAKRKVKMLNPNTARKVEGSVAIVTYIDTLLQRLEELK